MNHDHQRGTVADVDHSNDQSSLVSGTASSRRNEDK